VKSNVIALAALLGATLAIAGCEDKKTPPAPTTPATTTSATAANVELTDEDLAVPEDFLEEATKEVTKDNYKAEIDKIEKEIAATPQ